MRKTADIMGVPVDRVTMEEALNTLEGFLAEDRNHTIYTPNSEIMMAAYRDTGLKKILSEADLVIPDGAGVVLASRILGLHLPERVTGFDLVKNTFSMEPDRRLRYFLLGGRPGIAEAAAENIKRTYPGVEISGCMHGYFSEGDEAGIIKHVNESGADILLVALGAPKQEKWIHKYKNTLNVKISAGVGGSLDIFAGTASLAPEFFRKNGLEWLYRLYREPRRFKRMLDLPRFILRAVSWRIRN